jgi:hypothetical protein
LLKLQFFNWSHYILCFKCCSWHWLLFTSPMIFSGSSILKGHEHLIWIIMNTIWSGFCFLSEMSGFCVSICGCFLHIYCFHVTKFIDWLQILGNYLLKATFWLSGRTVCSVDQHNQLLGKDLAVGNKVYVQVGCASINFQWYNLSLRKVLMLCFSCLA